jgi:N-acetylglucosamine-6-sulfatase
MDRRAFLQSAAAAAAPALQAQTQRRNIVFILCDDHRFDMIGSLGHPWLKGMTPNMDRMVTGGVNFKNAFVTSSLCSPSRASILTGQYMHAHGVVDNFTPLNEKIPTFPRLLQQQGYRTAFIGKWHMGGSSDERRPGFDHWVSFLGQGEYRNPTINRNGDRKRTGGYMGDILTSEATGFIRDNASRPFCLYLSHKAVHYPFQPPERHAHLFSHLHPPIPATMAYKAEYYETKPEWVRKRRYTRHGVDGLFGHDGGTFEEAYRGYCRSLISVDDSVGAVLNELETRRLLDNTLIVYMGDNGYMWGEHGLVDKRAMYEESIRVPMVAYAPGMFEGGKTVDAMALNLDIGPTFLDAAGVKPAPGMHGASLMPLLEGKRPENWRKDFVYEYEWEMDYPYTPTITGLRNETHSLMLGLGVWDINELYDLRTDPNQMENLVAGARITRQRGRFTYHIRDAAVKQTVASMQERLEQLLRETGGDPRRAGRSGEGDVYAL